MGQNTELTLLYSLRATLHEMEVALGMSDLSDLERTILQYIAFARKTDKRWCRVSWRTSRSFKALAVHRFSAL